MLGIHLYLTRDMQTHVFLMIINTSRVKSCQNAALQSRHRLVVSEVPVSCIMLCMMSSAQPGTACEGTSEDFEQALRVVSMEPMAYMHTTTR